MPSWCFNFSKKDWKKSALSTCLGATQSASMSAPANESIYQEECIIFFLSTHKHMYNKVYNEYRKMLTTISSQ